MTETTTPTPAERAAEQVDAKFAAIGVSLTPAQRQAKIDAIVSSEAHAAEFAIRDAAEQARIDARNRGFIAADRARQIARNEY